MKIFNKILTASLIFILSLTVSGCSSHTCKFNKQDASAGFFASEATCTESAKYYLSCECGKKGTETFNYGEPLGHQYNWWTEDGNGNRVRQCSRDSSHTLSQRLDAWNDDGVLKILTIGNSFSVDSMEYVYGIAKATGVSMVELGNLYYGSCTLETHLNKALTDDREYTFYTCEDSSGWVANKERSLKYAVQYNDWDFISFQQGSLASGKAETYDYLEDLIEFVKPLCSNENVQFGWHMTWAYQGDSNRYPQRYENQTAMYELITGAVQSKVLPREDMSFVIPNGTSIQNARTSYVGDTLTRDGHHLSYDKGRFIASVTTVAALVGIDYENIDLSEVFDDEKFVQLALESAKNAVLAPFSVTQSQITE